MFLINSRLGHFSAATLARGVLYSEVTGLICLVPERVFSQAPVDIHLVYLCRFGVRLRLELLSGFSWQHEIADFTGPKPLGSRLRVALNRPGGLACRILLGAHIVIHQTTPLSFCVPASSITSHSQCRNINRLSISYAFRPRLRDRLTLSGLTFLRKP